jgi:hypothetical protein
MLKKYSEFAKLLLTIQGQVSNIFGFLLSVGLKEGPLARTSTFLPLASGSLEKKLERNKILIIDIKLPKRSFILVVTNLYMLSNFSPFNSKYKN